MSRIFHEFYWLPLIFTQFTATTRPTVLSRGVISSKHILGTAWHKETARSLIYAAFTSFGFVLKRNFIDSVITWKKLRRSVVITNFEKVSETPRSCLNLEYSKQTHKASMSVHTLLPKNIPELQSDDWSRRFIKPLRLSTWLIDWALFDEHDMSD